MNGYFLAIIIMSCLSLGINLARHGEPKEGEYDFIVSLIANLIDLILIYMAIKTGF